MQVALGGDRLGKEGQAWHGHCKEPIYENCPCDMVCPCSTSGLTMPADVERCRVVLVFHIDSGEVEGVDVCGLTVALLADTPQVMADGHWQVGVFMDEAAFQEQADGLGAVFSGVARGTHGGA
jgi:hypothetical protein